MLLTANSGEPTERWLLENEPAAGLRSDVLIVGAHQQKITGTPEFLRAVGARLIVCPFLADQPRPSPELAPVFCLETSGATRLRLYRDGRVEAAGFVDGRRTVTGAR